MVGSTSANGSQVLRIGGNGEHGLGRRLEQKAIERRSGSRLQPSLLRVTPSAVSERFSELIGCPISWSLATSCVCLELRLLPSTGITRLLRYYGPLRHPGAPGLSLTGVRLAVPGHARELPMLRTLSLCTCYRHYPGAANGRSLRSFSQSISAFPGTTAGTAYAFLFEVCPVFTRVAACTLAPVTPRFLSALTGTPASSCPFLTRKPSLTSSRHRVLGTVSRDYRLVSKS